MIPRAKLAKIYAEMFITDEWIAANPDMRKVADTSLVYDPILQRYGYTPEDYRATMEEYMKDPERYARILKNTSGILNKRLTELKKNQRQIAKDNAIRRFRPGLEPEHYNLYMLEEPYTHYYDSIAFEIDSTLWTYRLLPVETADTIYDRLEMIIRVDSLKMDSLAVDSLAVDSLAVDSLAIDSLKADSVKFKLEKVDMISASEHAAVDSADRKKERKIFRKIGDKKIVR